jgi:hypothetical protein
VTLEIRKGRRVVARVTHNAGRAGRGVLSWNGRRGTSRSGARPSRRAKPLPPGAYRTRITVTGNDSQGDADAGRLRIARRR